jgi:multicomponent Na+:H+ antiporter subunit G
MSPTVGSVLVVALVAVGCFFLTVGTVGLFRFPNVYNRMHATSKPTTLGTAAIFLAGFVRFGPGGAGLPSLGIVFLFLTVPTGAHMISRSAQRIGVPFLPTVTWPERADDDGDDAGDTAGDGSDGGDEYGASGTGERGQ